MYHGPGPVKLDKKNGHDAGDDWKKGKPVRVVRGAKHAKHSKYAPEEGNRYDGIYKVNTVNSAIEAPPPIAVPPPRWTPGRLGFVTFWGI